MNLASTFAVLAPNLSATPVAVTPTLFEELDPAGDEIVCLLSGRATVILEDGKRLELSEPGSFVIVPKGAWHTAKTAVPTKMVFVTPGEGTENKPC
jgi:uncharacterized cupin superfamily protein